MIKLSVLYPVTEGASFDHDYYRNKHVPLCQEKWGVPDSDVVIDTGISGPYVAAVHFSFADNDTMGAALSHPDMAVIQADIANYTTIAPAMQISSYDA